MTFKTKLALGALSLVATASVFAQAKPAAPDYTLAYNVGVVSDYRFRGLEQSAGKPSLSVGVDFAHKSGVYLGAWAANNIKWIQEFNGSTSGDYEVDLYGGYKGEITKGLGYDVGVITYQYPGNNSGTVGTPGSPVTPGFSKADTTEIYAGITYSVVSLKYFQSMGDFLGNLNSNGSRYLDLSANFDLGNGFSLVPHMGRQTIPNQNAGGKIGNAADYVDYSLTLAKDFGNGLVATAAAVATDANQSFYTTSFYGTSRTLGKSTFVLGLKYNF